MRNNEVDPKDRTLPLFLGVDEGGPMQQFVRSPEERKKQEDDIMKWLLNLKVSSLDPTSDFEVDELLPKKPGQKAKDRAKQIEGGLDWMRNKGMKPFQDDSTPPIEKLGSIPISRRTPRGP